MTQLERIEYMEQILDEAAEAVQALLLAIERYQNAESRIAELEAYYTSALWMEDYRDDCAKRLPAGLKRGVLSEDAVFDLLQLQGELKKVLKETFHENLSV